MSNGVLRITVMALLLLMAAGCSNVNPLHTTQTTLLQEYKEVRSWSAVQSERGTREREQLYSQEPSESNRLRLALALGFGKGRGADPKRALQLFEASAKVGGVLNANEALFADVFAEILKERLQCEAKISTSNKQVESLTKQAESERLRADELEKKLEALKSIEKSLRKR